MESEWVPRPPGDGANQREPGGEKIVSDRSLMEAIRDGSHTSLRILMQRYWSSLVAYAALVAESRDDAEDVVQETFVRVWQQRSRWTCSGAVNAYLFRITRNLALNARRNLQAKRGREKRGGAELFGEGSSRDPEKDFDTESLRAEVEAAIAALPERRREVFVLSRFHGLTHHEIAEALGLSRQTVANHMSVALADLRKGLSQHLHER